MRTIFFYEKDSTDVFAYFPDEVWDLDNNKTCYAHIGQHSSCSPGYAAECKLADLENYQDLKAELLQIYPDLEVLNEKQYEYHREPTPGEIKFGEGATHYKDFSFAQVYKRTDRLDFKRWIKCPIDNLRYYR